MKPKKCWFGLGLDKLWGLPDWNCPKPHPFHIAGIHHDAAHEAIDIFKRGYHLLPIIGDPYHDIVWVKFRDLEKFIDKKVQECGWYELDKAIKEFARSEDLLFKEMCLKLAKNSAIRKLEAHIFYSIVSAYTELKY